MTEMSLAESIRENTKAVQALTAAFATLNQPIVINASELPILPPVIEPAPEAPKALDYDADVKPVATRLAKANRDALVAILVSFDVKKATEIKPAAYAAFIDHCNAALEG